MSLSRRNFIKAGALGLGVTLIPSGSRAGFGGFSPNARLRIGIIGTGRQTQGLGARLAGMPGAVVVAACDVYGAKVEQFATDQQARRTAGETGGAAEIRTYRDYRELLDHPDLDVVLIATPDHQHGPMCIDALDRGLHVYCEKPLAHTVEEGRAMVDAVTRNGRVLQTGSMQRSMYKFQRAVDLIRRGGIGEVREILVSIGPPPRPYDLPEEPIPESLDYDLWVGPSVYRPFNALLAPTPDVRIFPKWRDFAEYGGGMVTDWGAHMFDVVQWALDRDDSGPVSFYPPGGKNPSEGLTMFYDNGVRVTHRQFGRGNAVRFIGTEGSLDVSRGFLDSTVAGLVTPQIAYHEPEVQHNVAHFRDFFAGITEGSPVRCPAETGHRSASVGTLANIAYRLRRPLYWDPATEQIRNDRAANRLLGPAYRMSLA